MPNIIEVKDPKGRSIICTQKQWDEHILANRSFMKGWEQRVKSAIENPMWMSQDIHRSDRVVYYGLLKDKPRYIRVVVEFKDNAGTVITAFPSDSGKSGEKMI